MSNFTFLDILLFPKSLYQKITDKKLTLYLGIIFVGLVDIAFPLLSNLPRYFSGKSQQVLLFNAGLAPTFVVLLGIVDVMFFSLPIFDIFKFFKRREQLAINSSLLVRVMKVYITAHFLILPVEVLFYYLFRNLQIDPANSFSYGMLVSLYVLLEVVLPIWFSAAIARGLKVIYKFEPVFNKFVFLIVFVWSYLLGTALNYMIQHWLLQLFR